jgi:hypothetical protein
MDERIPLDIPFVWKNISRKTGIDLRIEMIFRNQVFQGDSGEWPEFPVLLIGLDD